MVTTVCILDNINVAFREIFRILKPDGNILIGFIDKDSPVGQLYQNYKEENPFYRIATLYSVTDVTNHLKEAGFDNFHFAKTIFHDLSKIKEVEPVKQWYGEGSFVVIRANKDKRYECVIKHKNEKFY